MQRFHFEIADGYKIEDPVGLDCKNEEQARTVAQEIARHIAADVPGAENRTVVVVDDNGVEVSRRRSVGRTAQLNGYGNGPATCVFGDVNR